MRQIFTT